MCTNKSSAEVYKYEAEMNQRGEINRSARVHTSPRRRRTHKYKDGVYKYKAEVCKGGKSTTILPCTHTSKAQVYKYKAEVYKGREIKNKLRVHTSPKLRCTRTNARLRCTKEGELTKTSAYTQVQG